MTLLKDAQIKFLLSLNGVLLGSLAFIAASTLNKIDRMCTDVEEMKISIAVQRVDSDDLKRRVAILEDKR